MSQHPTITQTIHLDGLFPLARQRIIAAVLAAIPPWWPPESEQALVNGLGKSNFPNSIQRRFSSAQERLEFIDQAVQSGCGGYEGRARDVRVEVRLFNLREGLPPPSRITRGQTICVTFDVRDVPMEPGSELPDLAWCMARTKPLTDAFGSQVDALTWEFDDL